jgi:hypothetical protein
VGGFAPLGGSGVGAVGRPGGSHGFVIATEVLGGGATSPEASPEASPDGSPGATVASLVLRRLGSWNTCAQERRRWSQKAQLHTKKVSVFFKLLSFGSLRFGFVLSSCVSAADRTSSALRAGICSLPLECSTPLRVKQGPPPSDIALSPSQNAAPTRCCIALAGAHCISTSTSTWKPPMIFTAPTVAPTLPPASLIHF